MDQHQKQIVDYIGEHIKAGHSEATIRQHLRANGWSQIAVADAFTHYQQATAPKPRKPSKLRKAAKKLPRWSAARWAKTALAVVAVLAIGQGVRIVLSNNATPTAAPVAIHLNQQQRQSNDVNVIAGAVAYYTTTNGGTLPTTTVAEPDGSLELCNASCDPTTSTVSTLATYKAANVKVKAYAPSLLPADVLTIYLVPGATCKNQTTLGDTTTKPRAMIILYATAGVSGLDQHCVTL